MKDNLKILIVYYNYSVKLRTTVHDHLYCFQKYSNHDCVYFNAAIRKVPKYLLKMQFDLVIFHTLFLAQRWSQENFRKLVLKTRRLKEIKATKIIMPQDEFLNTDTLCDFINDYDIDIIFSVMPNSEWPRIYHKVDLNAIQCYRILTGYLADQSVETINAVLSKKIPRTVDIGYRAWKSAAWLGRHGMLKRQVAEVFQKKLSHSNITMDISVKDGDTFVGKSWFNFLCRCRYTIGVNGGSSMLDRDGEIKRRTEAYENQYPEADFDKIEKNCFKGLDGTANLVAISPRHLEACATKTCQILIEGDYNGILKPGKHFIELKKDFSNLNTVVKMVEDDTLRSEIVENAYFDIVKSGKYNYQSFVNYVIKQCDLYKKRCQNYENEKPSGRILFKIAYATENLSRCDVFFRNIIRNLLIRVHLINVARKILAVKEGLKKRCVD